MVAERKRGPVIPQDLESGLRKIEWFTKIRFTAFRENEEGRFVAFRHPNGTHGEFLFNGDKVTDYLLRYTNGITDIRVDRTVYSFDFDAGQLQSVNFVPSLTDSIGVSPDEPLLGGVAYRDGKLWIANLGKVFDGQDETSPTVRLFSTKDDREIAIGMLNPLISDFEIKPMNPMDHRAQEALISSRKSKEDVFEVRCHIEGDTGVLEQFDLARGVTKRMTLPKELDLEAIAKVVSKSTTQRDLARADFTPAWRRIGDVVRVSLTYQTGPENREIKVYP